MVSISYRCHPYPESRLITRRSKEDVPEDDRPISLKRTASDDGLLHTVAGITGLGWTGSVLGYLGTAIGYGNLAHPQSLLYLGGVLFVTTVGLDRLRDALSEAERASDRTD